jgi:hypothetical protein
MLLKILFILFILNNLNSRRVGTFWYVTDIHIDLQYKHLSDPDNSDGEILPCRKFFNNQTRRAEKFGMYNCDQPLLSFEEYLRHIKRETDLLPVKPDFILLGG